MSDYRCEHGEYAMGRYCSECEKERLHRSMSASAISSSDIPQDVRDRMEIDKLKARLEKERSRFSRLLEMWETDNAKLKEEIDEAIARAERLAGLLQRAVVAMAHRTPSGGVNPNDKQQLIQDIDEGLKEMKELSNAQILRSVNRLPKPVRTRLTPGDSHTKGPRKVKLPPAYRHGISGVLVSDVNGLWIRKDETIDALKSQGIEVEE